MLRRIIRIDEDVCNGCGLCVSACHEGAIAMVDGKARLTREDFCDGLGDCLPACPTGAIAFVERDAPAYDEAAVLAAQMAKAAEEAREDGRFAGGCPGSAPTSLRETSAFGAGVAPAGCPGSAATSLRPDPAAAPVVAGAVPAAGVPSAANVPVPAAPSVAPTPSQLAQWPCQIKLVPVTAPFFQNAKLLIAADCTAFAYGAFHRDFMAGRVTIIGCPKLDSIDYSEKLAAIIANNPIQSVEVLRMDVPCCGGLENAAIRALQQSGKFIPWSVVTIGRDGTVLDTRP